MSAPSHILCVFIFKIDSGVGFGTWALAQEVATQDVPVWNYVFRAAPTDLVQTDDRSLKKVSRTNEKKRGKKFMLLRCLSCL